jgi:hypothetical protein
MNVGMDKYFLDYGLDAVDYVCARTSPENRLETMQSILRCVRGLIDTLKEAKPSDPTRYQDERLLHHAMCAVDRLYQCGDKEGIIRRLKEIRIYVDETMRSVRQANGDLHVEDN